MTPLRVVVAVVVVFLCCPASAALLLRTFNGTGNHIHFSGDVGGSAGSAFLRVAPANMSRSDASSTLPSPRHLSNLVASTLLPHNAARQTSSMTSLFAFYGQWATLDLSWAVTNSSDQWPIPVPRCDEMLDPECTGTKALSFPRTCRKQAGGASPAENINEATAFIDAEQIYGTSEDRSNVLRTFTGGRLRSRRSAANEEFLPLSFAGNPHPVGNPFGLAADQLFFTGTPRINVAPPILALATLFLREHNRRADELASTYPAHTDQQLFDGARKWVIGLSQRILFAEYLPMLLGTTMPPYKGYNQSARAGISNIFTTAAFRYGHSELPALIYRLSPNAGGPASEWSGGRHIPLQLAVHRPDTTFQDPLLLSGVPALDTDRDLAATSQQQGEEAVPSISVVDATLQGLVSSSMEHIDTAVVEGMRSFLNSRAGLPGSDIVARNIQRGRDHAIPSYNEARLAFGLAPATNNNFSMITRDTRVAAALRAAYNNTIDDVDVFLGGLAESMPVGAHDASPSHVGPLFRAIILEQAMRLRSSDRMWYEYIMSPAEQEELVAAGGMKGLLTRNSKVNVGSSPFALGPAAGDGGGGQQSGTSSCPSDGSNQGSLVLDANDPGMRNMSWVATHENGDPGSVTPSHIFFTLTLPLGSFLGLGWGGKQDGMTESDMLIAVASADGRTVEVNDCWSATYQKPRRDTTIGGGTSDIELLNFTVTPPTVTLTAKRLMTTADAAADSPIPVGTHRLNVAWGALDSQNEWTYHTPTGRKIFTVAFVGPGSAAGPSRVLLPGLDSRRSLQLLHGVMMTIIWGINIAIGVFVARYTRHRTWWFGAHRLLQSITTVVTFPTLYIATRLVKKHLNSAHAWLGVMITLAASLQTFLGSFAVELKRMRAREQDKTDQPVPSGLQGRLVQLATGSKGTRMVRQSRCIHRYFGRLLALAAFVQIYLGSRLLREDTDQEGLSLMEQMLIGWGSCLVGLFIYFESEKQFALEKGVLPKLVLFSRLCCRCCLCCKRSGGTVPPSSDTEDSSTGRRTTASLSTSSTSRLSSHGSILDSESPHWPATEMTSKRYEARRASVNARRQSKASTRQLGEAKATPASSKSKRMEGNASIDVQGPPKPSRDEPKTSSPAVYYDNPAHGRQSPSPTGRDSKSNFPEL